MGGQSAFIWDNQCFSASLKKSKFCSGAPAVATVLGILTKKAIHKVFLYNNYVQNESQNLP